MTKTEAAEIIALRARVWARKTGQPVTKLAIQEHASELLATGTPGTLAHTAASLYNYRTAYRLALRSLRDNGEAHLIGR